MCVRVGALQSPQPHHPTHGTPLLINHRSLARALTPFLLAADATLRRWARTRPGDPLARADLAAFLRSAASTPADAARLLLAPGASEAAAEACVEAAEAQCVSDGSGGEGADSARGPTHLCGVDAAAHLLALLADEPVRLEPQPVPMCVMAPLRGTDALVTWEEVSCGRR